MNPRVKPCSSAPHPPRLPGTPSLSPSAPAGTPLPLLAPVPPQAAYLGPSLILPARQDSQKEPSTQAGTLSTVVPRISC